MSALTQLLDEMGLSYKREGFSKTETYPNPNFDNSQPASETNPEQLERVVFYKDILIENEAYYLDLITKLNKKIRDTSKEAYEVFDDVLATMTLPFKPETTTLKYLKTSLDKSKDKLLALLLIRPVDTDVNNPSDLIRHFVEETNLNEFGKGLILYVNKTQRNDYTKLKVNDLISASLTLPIYPNLSSIIPAYVDLVDANKRVTIMGEVYRRIDHTVTYRLIYFLKPVNDESLNVYFHGIDPYSAMSTIVSESFIKHFNSMMEIPYEKIINREE